MIKYNNDKGSSDIHIHSSPPMPALNVPAVAQLPSGAGPSVLLHSLSLSLSRYLSLPPSLSPSLILSLLLPLPLSLSLSLSTSSPTRGALGATTHSPAGDDHALGRCSTLVRQCEPTAGPCTLQHLGKIVRAHGWPLHSDEKGCARPLLGGPPRAPWARFGTPRNAATGA